jgi:magnesium-transporting ATPase (P-type)
MNNNVALNCSYWAKSHPKSAIFIIALSKITIALFALFFGISAYSEGWVMEPSNWRIILLIIAATCLLIYPPKALKARWGVVRYHRIQKSMDACLVAFGIVFWFFIGNGLPSWVNQTENVF